MEVKKSPKANLEKGKSLSFLMGLVLALSVVFVALEWHSLDAMGDDGTDKVDIADMEDVMFIPDQQQEPETPPEETPVETVEVALPEEFKAAIAKLNKGDIALVESTAGFHIVRITNTQDQQSFDEAKASLEAAIRYLAADLGQDGIRVNGISAGLGADAANPIANHV